MHTILVVLGMLSLAQCGKILPENEPVTARSLISVDAEATFQNDIKSDRKRFFVVFGYASDIPAVGYVTYKRCYDDVELVPIEGTGDALGGDISLTGNKRANAFSETYNGLMRKYLDDLKGVPCQIP